MTGRKFPSRAQQMPKVEYPDTAAGEHKCITCGKIGTAKEVGEKRESSRWREGMTVLHTWWECYDCDQWAEQLQNEIDAEMTVYG